MACRACGRVTTRHAFCSVACYDTARAVTARAAHAHKHGPNKDAYLAILRAAVTAGTYHVQTDLIVEGILSWHGRDSYLTDADCALLMGDA